VEGPQGVVENTLDDVCSALPLVLWGPREGIRLHDLRHTHASLLLAAGVPVHVVAQRLGHADPGFTMRVYGHLLPRQQRDAAELVAGMVVVAQAAD